MRYVVHRWFAGLLLVLLGVGGGVPVAHSDSPAPPIEIALRFPYNMTPDPAFTYQSFRLSSGSLYTLVPLITVPEGASAFGQRADIYVGIFKPNGQLMTWRPEVDSEGDMSTGRTKIAAGLAPMRVNTALQGEVYPHQMGQTSFSLKYSFAPDDVPGVYLYFVVVVEPGKDPGDPSHWITSKTRIVNVKP